MNKKLFMLKKIFRDLKSKKEIYRISENTTSKKLTYYYCVFEESRISTGKDQALISKFDQNGIPINKTYIDVIDKEYVYYPISIGQMGLSVFHTYLHTKKSVDKNRFLKFADWYYENAEISEKLGARWLTDVCLPQYKNTEPWQSAFSQSRGISILLRAYQITNNKKYLTIAEKALTPFLFSVKEGGVTSFTEWGPFYEEYTSSVPTLVFNGIIFSLFGVYDFVRVFPKNKLAKKIFNDGVQTIINILPQYDIGFWSKYNNCKAEWHPKIDPATIGYQRLHIVLLKIMYQLTNEKTFKFYYQKFIKQDTPINALRMYFLKYKSLKINGRL